MIDRLRAWRYGWRSTIRIYRDPELLAALTDETTIGDYGPVPAPSASS